MLFWIIAGFAVSACSITLSKSAMMTPYRKVMKWAGLENLARCHWCTSHWLAIAVVATSKPVVGGFFWLDLILAVFALVGIAGLISGLIMYYTPFNSEE
jgi:hypothetical protein